MSPRTSSATLVLTLGLLVVGCDAVIRPLFRQIDQHDVRVLARSVEDDLFPVGRDVERPQDAVIAEAGERTGLLRGEIEQPEIH